MKTNLDSGEVAKNFLVPWPPSEKSLLGTRPDFFGAEILYESLFLYSMMQSDRNSSKTDHFHKPTTRDQHVYTSSEQNITFARHKYGRVGVFRIQIRSLVHKL